MRLRWTGLRRPPVPPAARSAAGDDRVLGWVTDIRTGGVVVAGAHAVYAVSADGQVILERPWHLVDAGSWDRDASTLTVTWVDRAPSCRWTFDLDSDFPETFRARVQASVVLVEPVDLGGRGSARVVVRKDLSDQHLLTQAVLGPGVRSTEPGVREALDAAVARVREQVGLD